jgi:hypothetical protein
MLYLKIVLPRYFYLHFIIKFVVTALAVTKLSSKELTTMALLRVDVLRAVVPQGINY